MAGLRTLLELPDAGGAIPLNGALTTLRIVNATNAAANGGICCAWTVPANVQWVGVEVWGGGASGPGGNGCTQSKAGGAGSYARKVFGVTPGDVWTACAAGTTCCTTTSVQGFGSYFCKVGGTSTDCITASGGAAGCTVLNGSCSSGTTPIRNCVQGTITGASMGICGMQGFAKWNQGDRLGFIQFAPGAPYAHTGGMWGPNGCQNLCGYQASGGCTPWPGTGGFGAHMFCCAAVLCGAIGAQGLVQLTFMASQ